MSDCQFRKVAETVQQAGGFTVVLCGAVERRFLTQAAFFCFRVSALTNQQECVVRQ